MNMHKIQFARGIHQRDLLRANTLPSISRAKVGCFARIHLHEENARFLFVGIVILVYLTFGAFLFNYLEQENEISEREQYYQRLDYLRGKLCLNATLSAAQAGNVEAANKITLLVNDGDFADSASSVDGKIDHWRPSVYKVFGCIFTLCMIALSTAAGIYSYAEQWPYLDALYFCFTSFATIGFGDYVANTAHSKTIGMEIYRILNFMLLSSGACLVYCLFNVSSIVVKQMINWWIKKMDIKLENPVLSCCGKRKRTRYMGLGLRPPPGFTGFDFSERSSVDSTNDGLLSLKEFLMYNHQSSLVMLQKQLIKSAYRKETEDENNEKISATRVGPMGILSEKFGDE
uniref:Potassium channel domain-containing protein n=1 Tax=Panagrolaimus sp. JU765 TaxID=591449 RepID=A0AC34QZK0_9BILA